MDDPAVTITTHPNSATPNRLSRRTAPGLNVSRAAVDVLGILSSTDRPVVRDRPVATDDPERRATCLPSDALEYADELGVGHALRKRAVIVLGELPAAEVWREVAHYRTRRRCEPMIGFTRPLRMSLFTGMFGATTGTPFTV